MVIPSLAAFENLNNVAGAADLVSESRMQRTEEDDRERRWWWPVVPPDFLPQPHFSSSVAAVRASRRLLHELRTHARRAGRLQFCEVMWPTLAAAANLSSVTPVYLRSTTCCRGPPSCGDVLQRPLHWFHFVKNVSEFAAGCEREGAWPSGAWAAWRAVGGFADGAARSLPQELEDRHPG